MESMMRPDTSKRDKLLKALIGRGMSNDVLSEIVRSMAGKTQEEKEVIAEEIMAKYGVK